MNDKAIKDIVIIGGGSAGWLAAGIIAAEHNNPKHDVHFINVILIESPNISSIGVGEGTWPSMRTTLKKIGISETAFIKDCDVSLKQGTLFAGWKNGSDVYTHPFTVPHGYAEHNLVNEWQESSSHVPFAEAVCSQNTLMLRNQAPKNITTPEYSFNLNYGYHLDAGKFAEKLNTHCTEILGVIHKRAEVININSHENGDLKSLQLDSGEIIQGDLFIDCSGSRSLLLGKHYGIPFSSKQKYLFNDSAIASQVPYSSDDDPIASSTLSTAQSSGWIWDIGLPSRRGIGHVFSSSYTDATLAETELRHHIKNLVGDEVAEQVSTRKIEFSPGHREKFWHKNCVAIGMAAGFVEPLEASALVLVELSANMIAEQLPQNRKIMDIVSKRFNEKFLYRWNTIIDFLKLHYILTERDNSEYWRDNVSRESIPASLQEKIDLWKWQSPYHKDTLHIDEMFPSASYQYILYGMGFKTNPGNFRRSNQDTSAVAFDLFDENATRTKQLVSSMPTNRDFIAKVHQYGLQKI